MRIFCINSTWKGFDHDINKLKLTSQKNEYAAKRIYNHIHRYLHSNYLDNMEVKETGNNIRYFKLPYVGPMSLYIGIFIINTWIIWR